jgi:hypothetical protein
MPKAQNRHKPDNRPDSEFFLTNRGFIHKTELTPQDLAELAWDVSKRQIQQGSPQTHTRLWYGVFNWQGQVFTLYRHATNPTAAYKLMVREIATQKLRLNRVTSVNRYFLGTDKYSIKEVTEREKGVWA